MFCIWGCMQAPALQVSSEFGRSGSGRRCGNGATRSTPRAGRAAAGALGCERSLQAHAGRAQRRATRGGLRGRRCRRARRTLMVCGLRTAIVADGRGSRTRRKGRPRHVCTVVGMRFGAWRATRRSASGSRIGVRHVGRLRRRSATLLVLTQRFWLAIAAASRRASAQAHVSHRGLVVGCSFLANVGRRHQSVVDGGSWR